MKNAINIEDCHHCTFTMTVENSEHAVNIESSTSLDIKSIEVQNCQKGVSVNSSWNVDLNNVDINLNQKSVPNFKQTNLAVLIREMIHF